MKVQISYLKDSYQMNFVAIKVSDETVMPYINILKEQLGDQSEMFIQNQKKKSHNNYYINVINSTEYNNLLKKFTIDKVVNTIDEFTSKILDVTLLGLGKAQSGPNQEWFIIVRSDSLDEIRRYYDLPKKDFIITLGFYPNEVHGVRKNILVPIKDPFLKLLSQSYKNSDNTFNFLKELEFFDYDTDKEIDVIKIEDTLATFRIEQNYFSVSLIADKLKISAKWTDTVNKPKLSDTIITRKLKNI